MFSDNVKIEPFIGKEYEKTNPRILVLGESCYGDEAAKNPKKFVPNMISDIIEERWTHTFFTKVYGLFSETNLRNGLNKSDFWNSIAFYEYVQEGLYDARFRPTQEQWDQSVEPFSEVLEVLNPDIIFAMGSDLYNKLPDFGGYAKTYSTKVGKKTYESECWMYKIHSKESFLFKINHPSSFGFIKEPWIKNINNLYNDLHK